MLFARDSIEAAVFYFPMRDAFETPIGFEDVEFETTDGVTLHGWFMPAAGVEGSAPTILHLHGNAGNVSYHYEFSAFLTSSGFNVLVFDYRCFGRSEETGMIRRDLLLRDARAALSYLRTRSEVDQDALGLFGVSLGASIAAGLAAEEHGFEGVCLSSGFSSWKRIASDKLPLLGGLLIKSGMDIEDMVDSFGEQPLLVVHGRRDRVIPERHGRRIYDAAIRSGVNSELFIVEDAGHNDLPMMYPEAQDRIALFFQEHLTGN
jgi:fermentation-respiration switch protein FrsA (DUF1100 family)